MFGYGHKCKRYEKLMLLFYVNEDGEPTISALELDGSLSSPIIKFCPFCGERLNEKIDDITNQPLFPEDNP